MRYIVELEPGVWLLATDGLFDDVRYLEVEFKKKASRYNKLTDASSKLLIARLALGYPHARIVEVEED